MRTAYQLILVSHQNGPNTFGGSLCSFAAWSTTAFIFTTGAEVKIGLPSPKLRRPEEPTSLGKKGEEGNPQAEICAAAEPASTTGLPSVKAPASGQQSLWETLAAPKQ